MQAENIMIQPKERITAIDRIIYHFIFSHPLAISMFEIQRLDGSTTKIHSKKLIISLELKIFPLLSILPSLEISFPLLEIVLIYSIDKVLQKKELISVSSFFSFPLHLFFSFPFLPFVCFFFVDFLAKFLNHTKSVAIQTEEITYMMIEYIT